MFRYQPILAICIVLGSYAPSAAAAGALEICTGVTKSLESTGLVTKSSESSGRSSSDGPGEAERKTDDADRRRGNVVVEVNVQRGPAAPKDAQPNQPPPPKPKKIQEDGSSDNAADYKLLLPMRVRNEALRWLAEGATLPPSLLLQATLKEYRLRLFREGRDTSELSDAAVTTLLLRAR
jgi:hypothetical protein